MKALTIRQPWASLVALGVKTIETRSWSTTYRGPLLIHAGTGGLSPARDVVVGRWIAAYCANGEWSMFDDDGKHLARLPLGAVVAVCTLTDVVICAESDDTGDTGWPPAHRVATAGWGATGLANAIVAVGGTRPVERFPDQGPYGDYTPGRYAWLLADVLPLTTPVPAKGRQGLWTPDADLTEAVEETAPR